MVNNYSAIFTPPVQTIIDSTIVYVSNYTEPLYNYTNQISEWISLTSSINIGDILTRLNGGWILSSNNYDYNAESIGVVENVVQTNSGSLAKIVYKGIIDFSSDPNIVLNPGSSYFLSTPSNQTGPFFIRNATIEEPLVSKPIYIARTSTTALVVNMRGIVNNTQDLLNIPFFPDITCSINPTPNYQETILPNIYVYIGPCAPDNSGCSIGNTIQTVYCSDEITSYTVDADLFFSYNVASANQIALNYANSQLICYPSISNSIQTYIQGSRFNYYITASNNPISYNAENLVSGLTINTASGLIQGFPLTSSLINTASILLFAFNEYGTGSGTLNIDLQQFGNFPVTVYCPDNITYYTVPGYTFFANTSYEADLLAHAYAESHLVCPYYNTTQTVHCPFSASITYTVSASTVTGSTQDEANANAIALANLLIQCPPKTLVFTLGAVEGNPNCNGNSFDLNVTGSISVDGGPFQIIPVNCSGTPVSGGIYYASQSLIFKTETPPNYIPEGNVNSYTQIGASTSILFGDYINILTGSYFSDYYSITGIQNATESSGSNTTDLSFIGNQDMSINSSLTQLSSSISSGFIDFTKFISGSISEFSLYNNFSIPFAYSTTSSLILNTRQFTCSLVFN